MKKIVLISVLAIVGFLFINGLRADESNRYPTDVFGEITPFTEEDPKYQRGMDELSQSLSYISKARKELSNSSNSFPFDGVDYVSLDNRLASVQKELEFLLIPTREQYEYQRLVPQGKNFKSSNWRIEK